MTNEAVQKTEDRRLTGPEKGLVFLISLEEGIATRVLSHLSTTEVQQMRMAAEGLHEVSPQMVAAVHREFSIHLDAGLPAGMKGTGDYLRRLVTQALGERKAALLWSEHPDADSAVQQLAKLDVPSVLALIEREHPQTLAVILSQFAPARAAEIVKAMPSAKQVEVMVRLAQLKSVPRSVLEEIEKQFALELETMSDGERREINGAHVATEMLKRMEGEQSEALIEALSALDSNLADDLRKSMFTFEDLMRIDSRGMQAVLKEVSTEVLVVALKTASDAIREKVFGAVSSRAAAMLREELDMLGPVRVSDVEQAQQQVAERALALEKAGTITIAQEGASDFV